MNDDSNRDAVWRTETITPAMEALLRELHDHGMLGGLYLAGGTGLALHFGHRRSVDLDFFAPEGLDEDPFLQRLQSLPGLIVVARAPETLHLTIQGIKVSFLGYRHPVLFPFASFSECPLQIPAILPV